MDHNKLINILKPMDVTNECFFFKSIHFVFFKDSCSLKFEIKLNLSTSRSDGVIASVQVN